MFNVCSLRVHCERVLGAVVVVGLSWPSAVVVVGRSVGGSFGTFDLPLSESSDRVSSPLTFVVANHTNFLPACFSSFIASLAPSLLLRIAALHSKPAAQRAPADPRKSRLDFPI